jgi:hypothetical protein
MRLARPCNCTRPLWDGETCVRCGRTIYRASQRAQTPRKTAWTRAGVNRAIRAFVFFRGRAPMVADWEAGMDPQWPTLDVVHELFGSLPAAIESAGIAQIDA